MFTFPCGLLTWTDVAISHMLTLATSALLVWRLVAHDSVDRYEAARRFNDGMSNNAAWDTTANLWANVERTIHKQPTLNADVDSGFCYVDDDSANTMEYKIRRCLGPSCSDWSNTLLLRKTYKDTTMFLYRWTQGSYVFENPRRPKNGIFAWPLARDDTDAYLIVNQEYVQRILRSQICNIFNYWALYGVRQECP